MSTNSKLAQNVYDLASILTTAVITIMLVFTFVFRIAGVIGPSMNSTLTEGDKLMVSAFVNEPKMGDIIIITQPNSFNEPIVKRVIGLPGQKIDIDFTKSIVYVDGKKIDEPYVKGLTINKFDIDFPVTVPKGSVFVMGDNRQNSTDSRSSQIGFIQENYILGKVKFRVAPFGSWHVNYVDGINR